MSLELSSDYSQPYLLPPSVEDWIDAGHPARFLREVVEQLDLPAAGFATRTSTEGRPNYSASLLLRMWLYGYVRGVRSTRELERMAQNDMGMIWLTSGMATRPDHTTLSRFLKQHPDAIRRVFRQVVQLAMKSGLVGMTLHAVDGTRIKAVASADTGVYARKLTARRSHLSRELDALDRTIEARLQEIATNDERDAATGELPGDLRLPDDLIDTEARRTKIRQLLDELEAHTTVLHEQNRNSYHPKEPEAHTMQCRSERTFGYNAQAVADHTHGIIVAAEVSKEANDAHLLVTMMRAAESNTGQRPRETVASERDSAKP